MCTSTFGPMMGHISGRWTTKELWIDGHLIDPAESLKSVRHSPDGFNWSYYGSGPSQLSFAILQQLAGTEFALSHYQDFKAEFIANLPPTNFAIDIASICQWILAVHSVTPKGELH